MEVKIRPLADRVIIEMPQVKEKTAGGIIIPDSAKEKPQKGRVVASGLGRYENGMFVPMTVVVGDEVLFGKYSGTEIVIEDKTYLMMKESDIFAIV